MLFHRGEFILRLVEDAKSVPCALLILLYHPYTRRVSASFWRAKGFKKFFLDAESARTSEEQKTNGKAIEALLRLFVCALLYILYIDHPRILSCLRREQIENALFFDFDRRC